MRIKFHTWDASDARESINDNHENSIMIFSNIYFRVESMAVSKFEAPDNRKTN